MRGASQASGPRWWITSTGGELRHLEAFLGTAKEYFGDQFGKTFRAFFTDSFELISPMHWKRGFLEEFRRRRGYDIAPYLSAMYVPLKDVGYWSYGNEVGLPNFDFAATRASGCGGISSARFRSCSLTSSSSRWRGGRSQSPAEPCPGIWHAGDPLCMFRSGHPGNRAALWWRRAKFSEAGGRRGTFTSGQSSPPRRWCGRAGLHDHAAQVAGGH